MTTLNLQFGTETTHTLTVEPRPWDHETDCIVLVLDGLNDERSPVLAPQEARDLAAALTLAAEGIQP